MRTLFASLAISAVAWAQEPRPPEPPRPPQGEERRVRERAAQGRIDDQETVLQQRIAEIEKALKEAQDTEQQLVLKEKLAGTQAQLETLRKARRQEQDSLREALEELNARLKEKPDDAQAFLNRSELRRRLGDFKGADEDFAQAVKLNPEIRRRPPPPRPESAGPPGQERRRPPAPPEPGNPPVPRRVQPIGNLDEIRAWLKENEPETYRRLMQIQDEGRRDEVMEVMAGAEGRMRAMAEMKQRDPKGHERLLEFRRLETQSLELAEKVRRAPPEERHRAGKQLTEILGRLFDLREENRTRELAELKRRVEDIEKALAGRKANKDKIVDKRRKDLLGEKGEDDW